MLFNSYGFIFLFLPITLLGFHLLGRAGYTRLCLAWLAGASIFFYGWWDARYVALLLGSILFNYLVGKRLAQIAGSPSQGRGLLALGIAGDLALLGYYKYANFFVDNVNLAFGSDFHLAAIVLPLGISFFTFTQIAFLVDAWHGKAREYDLLRYVLFVTWFPHLIAGPVLHHSEMMPQFARKDAKILTSENLAVGFTIFFIGLFKKVIIADHMATLATPVFEQAELGADLGFFTAWTGAIAYTLQLYFDFSGYSDMAIGLSRLFGVRLPLNFDSPYRATSIIDFWRRWHMTLSRFLRDYLYIPLGGNRHGRARRHLNLFITMLLGGIWHGAGWTYIVWGALHGAYLAINTAWREWVPIRIDRWWSRLVARSLTLLCVVVGWVFFRAETLHGATTMLHGMANLPSALAGRLGPLEPLLLALGFRMQGGYMAAEHYQLIGWMFFWLAVLWLWPNTQQWMARFEPALLPARQKDFGTPGIGRWAGAWRPTQAWAIVCAAVGVAGLIAMSRVSEFLYFQF